MQLAGELLYIHLLITNQLKGQTKRDLIDKVLRSSSDPVAIPESLRTALDGGLANAGQSFLRHRPSLLIFLVEFMKAWKAEAPTEVQRLLIDPWAFKERVFGIRARAAREHEYRLDWSEITDYDPPAILRLVLKIMVRVTKKKPARVF